MVSLELDIERTNRTCIRSAVSSGVPMEDLHSVFNMTDISDIRLRPTRSKTTSSVLILSEESAWRLWLDSDIELVDCYSLSLFQMPPAPRWRGDTA